MGALEERQALDRAVQALRRIVHGERQGIRKLPQPSPQLVKPEQGRGQT